MTLTLEIKPEMVKRLQDEAARQGVPLEDYTRRLLERSLPPESHGGGLVELIDSWIEQGDEEEQKETAEYLIRVLDEDRLSNRKLFPEELRGISW